ncbi:hypothetical protein [Deinococcus pimensis]|uniref:hypothetical protein n=1 Tax=Deinococcus pimensis TaxID=309888 RepID=UPI0012FA3ED6|nr:hypothetical protein [Deinococcus pimensis]
MYKTTLSGLFALSFALSVTACGGGAAPSGGPSGSDVNPDGVTCEAAPPTSPPPLGTGALDTSLVGVWRNVTDNLELVFLADGRAFSVNTMSGSKVGAEPGRWQVRDGRLTFAWLVSGEERDSYDVSGDDLTLSGWMRLGRVGGASAAEEEFARQSGALTTDATTWQARYPVAAAVPATVKDDPHPEVRCVGANVYGAGLDVEDLTILTRSYTDEYQVVHEYRTFQAVEFDFFPNGRFWHNTMLPRGLDANHQPTYDLTTVWGHYLVREGDAVTGDTVTLVYDGGRTETARVLSGRRYLFLKSSGVLYLNQKPRPNPGG